MQKKDHKGRVKLCSRFVHPALFFLLFSPLLLVIKRTYGNEPSGKQERTVQSETSQSFSKYASAILENYNPRHSYRELSIRYPLDHSLFPSDIAAPSFKWIENNDGVANWLVKVSFESAQKPLYAFCLQPQWTPDRELWELMKQNSLQAPAKVVILGFTRHPYPKIISRGSLSISTSRDTVEAPVMFRRVPPIFSYAKQHPELLEWCLADVSSNEAPRVIMSKQPFCTSCHSFSRDGHSLGMDMDYKGDKGAYFLIDPRRDVRLTDRDFFSWNDFPREDGLTSSGLFSRLSPDGNYVASTLDDINLLAEIGDPYCSQLFFPIQGRLGFYSKYDRKIIRLATGADRDEIVETDPSWSPDGRYVLFSRAEMARDYFRELGGDTIFTAEHSGIEQLDRQYPVQFNIYRVPFNSGRGGFAESLPGASRNGKSNYFARYSPNGRWIVFTQSTTGLVLQPDSKLYLMPANGGKARMMLCNRSRVNSWHTWSPNSKWLAFTSKENTPYTELFLTHIDEYGNDSAPILLSRFDKPGYAINVPEFASIKPQRIHRISLKTGSNK
jgi:hypothetical protein